MPIDVHSGADCVKCNKIRRGFKDEIDQKDSEVNWMITASQEKIQTKK